MARPIMSQREHKMLRLDLEPRSKVQSAISNSHTATRVAPNAKHHPLWFEILQNAITYFKHFIKPDLYNSLHPRSLSKQIPLFWKCINCFAAAPQVLFPAHHQHVTG